MSKSVIAVLIGTLLVMVAATVWAPVQPRGRAVLMGVADRWDGVVVPMVTEQAAPTWDREFIWRRSAEPRAFDADVRLAGKAVGAAVPISGGVAVLWSRLAMELVVLLAVGGLLAIGLHVLVARRRARHEIAVTGPGPATPWRLLFAVVVGAALVVFSVGQFVGGPNVVERRVMPADLPKDGDAREMPAPGIVVLIEPHPAPPLDSPLSCVLPREFGRAELDEFQSRLPELLSREMSNWADRGTHIEHDGHVEMGRLLQVVDVLHPHRAETYWLSPLAPNKPPPPRPSAGGGLPYVRNRERYVVATHKSCDVHIALDGGVRWRPVGQAEADPLIPVSPENLKTSLNAMVRADAAWSQGEVSEIVAFFHVDRLTACSVVLPAVLACTHNGILRIAFVVSPK